MLPFGAAVTLWSLWLFGVLFVGWLTVCIIVGCCSYSNRRQWMHACQQQWGGGGGGGQYLLWVMMMVVEVLTNCSYTCNAVHGSNCCTHWRRDWHTESHSLHPINTCMTHWNWQLLTKNCDWRKIGMDGNVGACIFSKSCHPYYNGLDEQAL